MDDISKKFSDDLLSNRSAAAMARNSEREIADAKVPPVDLRTVPFDQWSKFVDHDVTLPPEIQKYLEGRTEPLTEPEVHVIEEKVEQFHGVQSPFYISMSITLQQTGRPWTFVKEASPYLTGLTLGRE